jgi:hypothetical protein
MLVRSSYRQRPFTPNIQYLLMSGRYHEFVGLTLVGLGVILFFWGLTASGSLWGLQMSWMLAVIVCVLGLSSITISRPNHERPYYTNLLLTLLLSLVLLLFYEFLFLFLITKVYLDTSPSLLALFFPLILCLVVLGLGKLNDFARWTVRPSCSREKGI